MKVSVIIASYNKGDYIKETLNSVINQSYSDIEIILINDGSTDNSPSICRDFSERDSRIIYISQTNQGVIKTRNTGLRIASGDLILPFDADDIMPIDFIKSLVQSAEKNPDITVFSTRLKRLDGSEIILPEIGVPDIFFRNSISNSSAFRRSALAEVNGYNENMSGGYEDWDFWLYFLEKGFLATRLNETFYYYRTLENSRNISANKMKENLKFTIYNNHKETYEKWRPHQLLITLYPLTKILRIFGLKRSTLRAIKFYRKIDKAK